MAALERELEEQLRAKLEETEKLQKENCHLKEVVTRKDETIEQLVRDIEAKAIIIDRCNKTESTSRESDNHLRDREAAILQAKNSRLRKQLKAKQQTVAELLRLVGKVTAQEGIESSAVEEDAGEDDEDEDEDGEEAAEMQKPGRLSALRSATSPAAKATASVTEAKAAESTQTLQEHLPRSLQDLALPTSLLESTLESPMHDGRFPRAPASSPAAPTPTGRQLAGPGLAPASLAAAAAALGAMDGAGAVSESTQPDAQATQLRSNSLKALQALDTELEALEEKKRVVERLAKGMESSSNVDRGNSATQAADGSERAGAGELDDPEGAEKIRALEADLAQLERDLGLDEGSPPPLLTSTVSSPQHAAGAPPTPVCSPVAGINRGAVSSFDSVSLATAVSRAAAARAALGAQDASSAGDVRSASRPGVKLRPVTEKVLLVLDRELEALEAKKRAVEQLAKTLGPPSDDDDDDDDSDDGFPLR